MLTYFSRLLTMFDEYYKNMLPTGREVLINGVICVLLLIAIFVFVISLGITIENIIKKCKGRRRRNAEAFEMNERVRQWNVEQRRQSRQSRARNTIPDNIIRNNMNTAETAV